MTRSETTQRWTERLRRFEHSQMTVAQFCAVEGISQPSFYHWRRKLRAPSEKMVDHATKFIPVSLQVPQEHSSSAADCASTTIELPGGIRIRVEVPTDPRQAQPGAAR